MPVPTRLANDGWWLCDHPSVALVCNISLQPGSADMTDFTTPASDAGSARESTFSIKPAVALALAALADWLFYGERVGISAVAFSIALVVASLLANFTTLNRRQLLPAGILVLAGLVPAVEEFNPASQAFLALALGVGLQLTTHQKLDGLGERTWALCDLYLIGPFRFFRDMAGTFNLPALTSGVVVWFIPMVLGSIFALLFVSANPLLEKWIRLINPGAAGSYLSFGRVLFWVVALSIVWPFIHVWWRSKIDVARDGAEAPCPSRKCRQVAPISSARRQSCVRWCCSTCCLRFRPFSTWSTCGATWRCRPTSATRPTRIAAPILSLSPHCWLPDSC